MLDTATIERLRTWGGEELPGKLIRIFLSHTPERAAQIREGIEEKDPRKAGTGAHSLKSSAGNVGAIQLQRLCQEIEILAEEGNIDGLETRLSALEQAFDNATEALNEYLEAMKE